MGEASIKWLWEKVGTVGGAIVKKVKSEIKSAKLIVNGLNRMIVGLWWGGAGAGAKYEDCTKRQRKREAE